MQAWRSLVTPWVVQHRRCSSWCLWGSHILLLYILHICSLSHCGVIICAINCGQIIFIQLIYCFHIFHYFFIIFIIIIFFIIIIVIHVFAAKSGTYLVMTLLCCSKMCLHLFHSIFLLCCFIPLGSTGRLVCDTAFGMQHIKFLGGMCYPVRFG